MIRDSSLVQSIGRADWDCRDHNTAIEVCRLGGNLCYESPAGRRLMLDQGILEKLSRTVASLEQCDSSRLWLVLPSFLHNFCHDNPGCLASPSVTEISSVLAQHFSSLTAANQDLDAVAENYISFLSGLQSQEDKTRLYQRSEVVLSVINLLEILVTEETVQTVLEFLQEILESEEVSAAFTEQGLVKSLLSVSSKAEEETANLSLDVLVLLSSQPTVLPTVLSPSQECPLWISLLSWLSSPPSPHHLATAALLTGNISTSSPACLEVMETSAPANVLLHLNTENKGKVLHAVLGCLRNLAVCQPARQRLLQLSLAEKAGELLVTLSSGQDQTVTAKLMSTLRLVSQDSQETCRQLGSNTDLVTGTVKIGGVSVVPGLNIEASRLLSSLLRYSKDPEVSDVMIQAGAVPLLLGLLNSPHSQLINEMLVALNLLTAVRPPSRGLVENIDPAFLAGKVLEILQMEETKCPKEVKFNAISLVNSVLQWRIPGVSDHFSLPQLRG